MITIVQVRARLELLAMPPLRLVEGAISYAALPGAPPVERRPAAYVIPIGDNAGENRRSTGPIRQHVTQTFGVVLALGAAGDPRGARAADDLDEVRLGLKAALLGWQIDEHHDPVERVRGDLVGVEAGVVWWLDRWRARYHEQGS